MKLVMTLLVRNEEDILEANLAYHFSQGVDFVIAIDHKSVDGTVDILRSYAGKGLLHLIRETADEYRQSEWVTRAARLAATEFGADWVINADADEFHWPEAGTLKDIFAAIPPEFGALTMPTLHFVPRPEESGFFADRMAVREVRSLKSRKSLRANMAHRGHPEVNVSMGNHRVTGSGLAPVPAWHPISVLHFPLRSYKQYERKIIQWGPHFRSGTLQSKGERTEGPYKIYAEGRLPALYADKVVTDEGVVAGIREGRLMFDNRLKRFFDDCRDPATGAFQLTRGNQYAGPGSDSTGGRLAWPDERPEVADLRADAMRAIRQWERDPIVREVNKLRSRLTAIESSHWWRLRPRGLRRR